MPRIAPPLRNPSQRFSSFLAPLIIATRSLSASQAELRWLVAHARSRASITKPWRVLLRNYVLHRKQHVPLQYILGSEFFGPLEIRCRRGVLIPRHETASIVTHLANVLKGSDKPSSLSIIDFCTGTGAIALLLSHLLPTAAVLGVDVSPTALAVADANRELYPESNVRFARGDVHSPPDGPSAVLGGIGLKPGSFDVLVSNPPYISAADLRRVTARSVREREPRLALAGGADGDDFYPALLGWARYLQTRYVLLEVGDAEQGVRVAKMAKKDGWAVQLWRDSPELGTEGLMVGFIIRGEGNVRAVFCERMATGVDSL